MGRLHLNEMAAAGASAGNNSGNRGCTAFSLKDDGDFALVRFLYSDPEQVTGYYVHEAKVFAKAKFNQLVKCNEEGCPMCAARIRRTPKLFLILEDLSDGGTVKVWARSSRFSKQVLELFEEYGDRLCDYKFKIKRSGAAGSRDTTYFISAPRDNHDPVDLEAYDIPEPDYPLLITRTNEEMLEFVETGAFPDRKKTNDASKKAPAKRRAVEEDEDDEEEEIVPRRMTVREARISKIRSEEDEADELI